MKNFPDIRDDQRFILEAEELFFQGENRVERSRGLGKAESLPVTRHPVILQRCGELGYFWGQKFCAVTSRREGEKFTFLRKVFCELAEETMSLLCSHIAGGPT